MVPIYLLLCGLASASASLPESFYLEAAVAEKWATEQNSTELDESARFKSNHTNAAIDKITGDAFSYLDALDKEMGAKGEMHEAIDVKGSDKSQTVKDCAYLDEDFIVASSEAPKIIDCNYHYGGGFVKAGKGQMDVTFDGENEVHTEAPIIVDCDYHGGFVKAGKDQKDVIFEDKKDDDGLSEEQKMDQKVDVKRMVRMIPEILICDYTTYPEQKSDEEKKKEALEVVAVDNEQKKKGLEKEPEEKKKEVEGESKGDEEEQKQDLEKEEDQKDVAVEDKKDEKEKGGEQTVVEMPCVETDAGVTEIMVEDDYHDDVVKAEAKKADVNEAKKKEIVIDGAKKGMGKGAVKAHKAHDDQKTQKAQKAQTKLIDCFYLDENYVL